MRILIVDDDEMSLMLLEYALKGEGHEVASCTSGKKAVELALQGNFQVVISDWEMPEISGPELCRAIREHNTIGYIYIILVTGHDGSNSVEGLEAGADDFITKPINPAALQVRLRAAERILSIETRDLTIFAMARLAESRDPESNMHLERVRHYSRILAEQLAVTPKFKGIVDANYIRLVFLTSPLHDIGKVAIPDTVLMKKGRWNQAEFEIYKRHPQFGAETLAAALREHPEAKFLVMAREIALTHHERWDGSGYPEGLSGEDIPLCGRIVALADAYDGIIMSQNYSPQIAHELAKDTISEQAWKQFDPDVVDAFMAVEKGFLALSEQYATEQRFAA